MTVQAMIGEALNDLFPKHGKPEILRGRLGARRFVGLSQSASPIQHCIAESER